MTNVSECKSHCITSLWDNANQLGIGAAVPVHSKPMAEGGGGFWRGWRGTGAVIDYISHH